MQENINLGAVQAPYWEQVLTLQPGETRKVDYVYDSFNLLQASIPEVLEVTFGGAATQTKFSAGMGYHLSAPVSYIQLFNTSDSPLTIDFSLAVGGITDNRVDCLRNGQHVNQIKRIQQRKGGFADGARSRWSMIITRLLPWFALPGQLPSILQRPALPSAI